MRCVGAIGLLYPQRDRLRHQIAMLERGRDVDGIDAEFVVAADAGAATDPLGQELISPQRGVQLD